MTGGWHHERTRIQKKQAPACCKMQRTHELHEQKPVLYVIGLVRGRGGVVRKRVVCHIGGGPRPIGYEGVRSRGSAKSAA